MKTKSIIELREIDLRILQCIKTKSSKISIANVVFPKAEYPSNSLTPYLDKHISYGYVKCGERGIYSITPDGKKAIKMLIKLQEKNGIL